MSHKISSARSRRCLYMAGIAAATFVLVPVSLLWASAPPRSSEDQSATSQHRNPRSRPWPRRVRRLSEAEQRSHDSEQELVGSRRDRLAEAYRQGLEDGRLAARLAIRAQQGYSTYQAAMQDGHAAFVRGEYGKAVRHFIFAEQLDQGDPTARLCGCYARAALGHFEDAARVLHRALELEPRLAYLPLSIRDAYGLPRDLDQHIERLRLATEKRDGDPQLWFLLGYYRFFTGRPAAANAAMERAYSLSPDDPVIAQLADVVRLSTQVGAIHSASPDGGSVQLERPRSSGSNDEKVPPVVPSRKPPRKPMP